MATTTPDLVYAPPLPWRRRRTARRLLGTGAFLLLAASASLWFTPLRDRALVFYWQQKCVRHVVPPATVVHDYPTLGDSRTGIRMVPREWSYLYGAMSPPGLRSEGTVFLHQLQAPSGARRLVAVDVLFKPRPHSDFLVLSWRVVETGSPFSRPRILNVGDSRVQLPVDFGYFRVLAGKPDEKDPSRFTFACEFAGQSQTIEGWLYNDDRVMLEKRRD